jgi:threonine/homoserine/homoserine lactone efflux protein
VTLSPAQLAGAFLAGSFCGFVVAVPPGPVNLTVINQALRKGFLVAFLTGLGAVVAETIYASAMLAGHSSIMEHEVVVFALQLVAVGAIAVVGVRSVLFRPAGLTASEMQAEKLDLRWHHPRAFILGFVLTVSNLLLLVLWATLATALFAHHWVEQDWVSRTACTAGVAVGGGLWFFLLAWFVAHAHRRVSANTLTLLVRGCGVVFLGVAVSLAYRLLWQGGARP